MPPWKAAAQPGQHGTGCVMRPASESRELSGRLPLTSAGADRTAATSGKRRRTQHPVQNASSLTPGGILRLGRPDSSRLRTKRQERAVPRWPAPAIMQPRAIACQAAAQIRQQD